MSSWDSWALRAAVLQISPELPPFAQLVAAKDPEALKQLEEMRAQLPPWDPLAWDDDEGIDDDWY